MRVNDFYVEPSQKAACFVLNFLGTSNLHPNFVRTVLEPLAFCLKTICAGTSRLQDWGHSAQTLCRRPHCVGPGNGWGRTGSCCGNMGGNNPFRCSVPAHAHIDKSGVFSGWGPSREAMLRLLPGVQPLRTLKDLGVQQLAGAAGMRSLSRGPMPRPGGSNA